MPLPGIELYIPNPSAHFYLQHFEMSADNEVGWVKKREKARRFDLQTLTIFPEHKKARSGGFFAVECGNASHSATSPFILLKNAPQIYYNSAIKIYKQNMKRIVKRCDL